MATNNIVNFTININGNAYNGVVQLGNAVSQTLNPAIKESKTLFEKVGNACFLLNSIFDIISRTIGKVVGKLQEFEQAGRAQAEAETKLAQVMRNTMGEDIARRHDRVSTALKQEREAVESLSLSFRKLPSKVEIPEIGEMAARPVEVPVGLKPKVTGEEDVRKTFDGIHDKIRDLSLNASKGVDVRIGLKPAVTGEKEVESAFDRIRKLPVPGDREVRIGLNMKPEVTGDEDVRKAFDKVRDMAVTADRNVDVGLHLKPAFTGEKEVAKTIEQVRKTVVPKSLSVQMGVDMRPVVHGEEDVVNAMERIRAIGESMTPIEAPVEIVTKVTGGDAVKDELDRIKALTAAQQKTGVIGDEIQLAGAQELAVHLSNVESLEKLIPVMNDLTAKQQGFKATQEGAVSVAAMMGKAMDGNVMMLERAGIKFSEVQKKIMQTGTEEQRAATLAEVLKEKVGGMNEALANTPEGRVVQLNNAYGDLQERLGGMWTNLKDTLFPVFDGLIEKADGLITQIEGKLGAVKEWVSGAAETVAAVWDSIRGPVVETAQSLWTSVKTIVGNVVNSITGIVRDHGNVVRGVLRGVLWAVRTLGKFVGWLSGVVTGFVNFVSGILPIVLGFATAIGIVTLAIKAQAIETTLLNGATALGTAIGTLFAKVWTVVNAVMTANPVGLIIAGVVALAGVIVFLCMKIKGWGTLWEAVVNFAKHTFTAFTYLVQQKWNMMTNGLMIGLDKIKEAWYKFRIAVGIGDEGENKTELAKIASDVKARQNKIAAGSEKIREELKAAADSWKGVHLEWDAKATPKKAVDKIKAQLGITDASAVTNNIDNSTETTDLNNDLSDASTKISSGGKNIKNINITINDGLVHGVQNYFNSSDENPDTASDFMWRLANALQLVVNDVNYD